LVKVEEKKIRVFSNKLVPKHVKLTKNEENEVLSKFHIKPYQLPYIKKSDPAILEIGAKEGDIVKIFRRSSTAGEVVVYRYVV